MTMTNLAMILLKQSVNDDNDDKVSQLNENVTKW